jgi:hypothetical protein
MPHPSLIPALLDLQENGTGNGAYIYEAKTGNEYLVGTLEAAEAQCRYHFVEVRGVKCRVIERAYNYPMGTEWIVRPWTTIELAIIAASRPAAAA